MPCGICDTFVHLPSASVPALPPRRLPRAPLHSLAAGLLVAGVALTPIASPADGVPPTPGYERCGPGFVAPAVPVIASPSALPGAVDIEADDASLEEGGVSVLTGDVQVRRDARHLSADEVRYDSATEVIDATGNVRVWGEGVYLSGGHGVMALADDVTVMEDAQYLVPADHARGDAGRVVLTGEDVLKAADARFTTCNPDDPVWVLHADKVRLDKAANEGVGRNVWVEFKGVPIFYSPYLSFPLTDARKSGFLAPSVGASSSAGAEATVPYYFNIAPNMDATLGVRAMEKRGAQLQGEYRYLFPWGTGQLRGELLPDDDKRDESRYGVSFKHSGVLRQRWHTNVNFGWVSDQEYFEDLGTSLEVSSVSFIEQRADVTYSGDSFYVLSRVQNFQTVDRDLDAGSRPYKRLPQLLAATSFPERNLRFNVNGAAELVHFDRRSSVTGMRWDLSPHVTFPYRTAAGYVVPKATLRYTGYALDDNPPGTDDDPSRLIPTFSLDSGLFFERPFRFRDRSLLQTLEPRLFYLFVPFDDQDDLPVFDTGEYTFSFSQLFREDRFSGADRVGDAHQVTLALTSRFLDSGSGAELGRVSVGSIIFFRDRKVTLPDTPRETDDTSALVADVSANLDGRWRAGAGIQWDPHETRTDRATVSLRYAPDARRLFNASYRFVRDTVEQTDLSFAWPLANDWRAVGRFDYSLDDKKLLETFAGFEYESCCWGLRLVGRRYLSSTQDSAGTADQYNSGIYAQLVLKGLSSFGDAAEFLGRSIPGYRNEF
jgi:LPS-assembly protein